MKIYVGTSGFAHKEWIGKFYPEKTPPKKMLHVYSEHLKTVEINNTFYHMPNVSVLASWAEQVPHDFVFAIKAPQVITHMKRLRHVGSEATYLFKSVSVLEKKLGPILFQLPESFHADTPLLLDFLARIPGDASCAFDFRSPTWLEDGVLNLLREKGCSWCVEDTDEKPITEIISTAPWGYLRLRRSDYTDLDMSQWVERILSQKWEKSFVFFKHEEGPKMAMRFREIVDSIMKGEQIGPEGIRKAG